MSILGRIINRGILNRFGLVLARTLPRPFERIAVKGLIGVEIGVLEGVHALSILKTLNIHKLYLIDPYETDFNVEGEIVGGKRTLLNAERKARELLKKYKYKIIWVKGYSADVKDNIPNGLDFVYIDGGHDYKNVKQDLENYYPKVKIGGIIGGHDIENGNSPDHEGLTKAVLEFVNKYKLTLVIQSPDWWVRK